MAKENWSKCFEWMLKHEGGWSEHPNDPGGATNLGVTIGTLSDWLGRPATKAEVRALTRDDVEPIYKQRYWDACQADDLPAGIDHAVVDFGVNSGPRRAIIGLQRALGVADDGVIGPITLAAAKSAHPLGIVRKVCAGRLHFMRQLSTWPTFGRGWQRRVDRVEQEAAGLIKGSAVDRPPDPPTEQQIEPDPPESGFFNAIRRLFEWLTTAK